MAIANHIPWQHRGPPGPSQGGPTFWRNQPYRPLSQKWAKRGGRHKEYFAQKYGTIAKEQKGKYKGKGKGDKGKGKGDKSEAEGKGDKGQAKGSSSSSSAAAAAAATSSSSSSSAAPFNTGEWS